MVVPLVLKYLATGIVEVSCFSSKSSSRQNLWSLLDKRQNVIKKLLHKSTTSALKTLLTGLFAYICAASCLHLALCILTDSVVTFLSEVRINRLTAHTQLKTMHLSRFSKLPVFTVM